METIIATVIELNEIYPATSGSSEENMNNFTNAPFLCLLYSNYDVMEDISMPWTWLLTQGSWEIDLVKWAGHMNQLNQLSFFLKALKYSCDLVMENRKLHLNPFRRPGFSQYIISIWPLCFSSNILKIRIYTYIYLCVCVYVHIHTHTHIHFANLYFVNTDSRLYFYYFLFVLISIWSFSSFVWAVLWLSIHLQVLK